jgi:hypothetical protein
MATPAYYRSSPPVNGREISRLLTAAVVNRRFCQMLLANPANALAHGYNGEAFLLESEARDRVLSIRAKNLADFAAQLMNKRSIRGQQADRHTG